MAFAISILDVVVSAAFTVLVARQWLARRRRHHLLWAGALAVWTVAVSAEAVAAYRGTWQPLTYRVYYTAGALLVAPWLGAGSLFLVTSHRQARAFLVFVVLLSLLGSALIFAHPIDRALLTRTDTLGFVQVKVFPFVPTRLLIVVGNVAGTVAFVGSAFYSVYQFWRNRIQSARMIGVLMIGLGGLVAAAAHSLGVLGGPSLFRISELVAISVIFAGYLVSTLPERRSSANTSAARA